VLYGIAFICRCFIGGFMFNRALKKRIAELEEQLVLSQRFSHTATFLEDQNKQLTQRFNAYKNSTRSLCVEVRKFGYGSIAAAKHENRVKNL
jgi:hypothetical protein